MTATGPPPKDQVRAQIEREIAAAHRDSYEQEIEGLEVGLHESFVVLITDVQLSRAERTLVDGADSQAVRESREAFQEATAATFSAIVERATGRRVTAYSGRTVAVAGSDAWTAEVFRLG